MIRTQISLPASEYERVKQQARRLGVSVAEVVRRAIRETLPPKKEQPWMWFAGCVASGDPSSSQNIDDVVYGSKD